MKEEHISDPAIVNQLLLAMDCPASECLCEYEGKHLVSLHIRCALSGIVVLRELIGGSSVPLELVPGKEPGSTYRMRASCRGREMLEDFFTLQWDEDNDDDDEPDPFPHGLEQYLFQFWPV